MKRITPYDFQSAAVAELIASTGNPLVVKATGTGKSIDIAEACRLMQVPALVLVPTQELCEQNEEAVRAVWPEADVGILCGGLRRREHQAQVLIATTRSVYELKKRDRLGEIGRREVIFVDEAHGVRPERLGMIHEIIGVLRPVKVAGLTATAYRLDSGLLDEGEDRLFDSVVYEFGLLDGIAWRGPAGERLLVPLTARKTATMIDTKGVKIHGGDFVQGRELAERANSVIDAAVDEMIRRAEGRQRWLAFCCAGDHPYKVADALQARGVTAETVTYRTNGNARRDIIARFRRGDITCLTGMNVFTTGFNVREIDLIAFLRPTMSPSLYVQMAGRGTRWVEGKENCLVLDFARNVERLGPVDNPRIRDRKDVGPGDMKACPECDTYVPVFASYCDHCGHVFEQRPTEPKAKHEVVASDLPVISTDQDLVWHSIRYMNVKPHSKVQTSVRLGFLTTRGHWFNKYLSFDSPNMTARHYARQGWRELCGNLPAPASTVEALKRGNELKTPSQIGVRWDGKYWNVKVTRHAG